ncbi:nuclear transport factor 2 family protein [Nocardia wallacei]|uniref:nuclear transport factor 2 family protein n=1 Tax=Nocardia wallacei TaxID=480035 RepID=UPI002454934F|nr:nuclear transport factor 2 family protein [Nocardia wallacei]
MRFSKTPAIAMLALIALITASCARNNADGAPQLSDHDQIAALVPRLGTALDERNIDQLRVICTDDITVETPGGRSVGHDAVIAQANRIHTSGQQTQHVLTDIVVDLQRDRAEVRANSTATFVLANSSTTPATPLFRVGEIYRFRAARTDHGWRLSRVASTPVWGEGTLPPTITRR